MFTHISGSSGTYGVKIYCKGILIIGYIYSEENHRKWLVTVPRIPGHVNVRCAQPAIPVRERCGMRETNLVELLVIEKLNKLIKKKCRTIRKYRYSQF